MAMSGVEKREFEALRQQVTKLQKQVAELLPETAEVDDSQEEDPADEDVGADRNFGTLSAPGGPF